MERLPFSVNNHHEAGNGYPVEGNGYNFIRKNLAETEEAIT